MTLSGGLRVKSFPLENVCRGVVLGLGQQGGHAAVFVWGGVMPSCIEQGVRSVGASLWASCRAWGCVRAGFPIFGAALRLGCAGLGACWGRVLCRAWWPGAAPWCSAGCPGWHLAAGRAWVILKHVSCSFGAGKCLAGLWSVSGWKYQKRSLLGAAVLEGEVL